MAPGLLEEGPPRAPDGSRVLVKIGDAEHPAIVSDGTFAATPGQLALAPGSSGWPGAGGEPIRWLEVFLRGGNASDHFGRPAIGSPIEVVGRG